MDTLTCVRAAEPMLQNFAITYHLEYDDLYQEAYLVAHSVLAGDTSHIANVPAYIQSKIRYHVLDLRGTDWRMQCESLDAPLAQDQAVSLADVLPASESATRDESDLDRKEQALYAALRRLPLEDQQFLREVYQLNGYEPVPLYPYSLNHPGKTRHATSNHAWKYLRRDSQLKEAIIYA